MSGENASAYAVYSHRLHQRNDPKLKERIERLARRYERLCKGGGHAREAERMRSARADLFGACLKYFYVTGSDLTGKSVDSILLELLDDAIARYDSDKGQMVHYIARVYRLRVLDEGKRLDQEDKQFESLDDNQIDESYDGRLAYVDERLEADVPGAQEEDEGASGAHDDGPYLRFLSALMGFLEHKEDNRHQPRSKLYYRMVFVERITYAVKSQELVEYCSSIERHERDTFAAMELGFLDSLMVEEARSVAALWSGDMQNGHAAAIKRLKSRMDAFLEDGKGNPPKVRWLDISSYKSYLKDAYAIEVSNPVISMQRARFDELECAIGL